MRFFLTFCIAVLLSSTGCQKKTGQVTPEPDIEVKISDVKLSVNNIDQGVVTARPKTKVAVKGSFRLTDPAQTPRPVVIHFVRTTNGTKVVHNSGAFHVKKQGETVTFEGAVATPHAAGSFDLEVLHGGNPIPILKQEAVISD